MLGHPELIPGHLLEVWRTDLIGQRTASQQKLILLFGNAQATCCDEAVVVRDDGRIVAVASISPFGERTSPYGSYPKSRRRPSIVGVYVDVAYRGQGLGLQILQAAVERMVKRHLLPIYIDALSIGMIRIIEKLPKALRKHLRVTDGEGQLDYFPG